MSHSMEKGLDLLDLVAAGNSTLGELVEASRMPKSTVHRLAAVLVAHGILRLQANEYHLGYRLLELGELTKQQIRFPDVARQHMERTARTTNETVHLGELVGSDIVYLEKIEGARGLQMRSRVGLKSPAQTTAMGKVLLAHLPPEQVFGLLGPMTPRTSNTIVDPDDYLEELRNVRRLGYALDREENEVGIRCVAAPIRDARGEVVAAVSISGAVVYISEERQQELIPEVIACAQAISRGLGGERYSGDGQRQLTGHPE
jgi:DNA-binding IclR family transcriptional regulator